MIEKILDAVGDWLSKKDSERIKTVTYIALLLVWLMLLGEIVRALRNGWLQL